MPAIRRHLALAATFAWLTIPAPAAAETRWVIRGAGWGHGIGMSQWGAYGFARRGATYRRILAHYYTGTAIGRAEPRTIRVLLKANRRRITFSGAEVACGRRLDPARRYRATRGGQGVALRSAGGKVLGSCPSPLRATGPAGIAVAGRSRYRGALEVRAGVFGGVTAVNAVGLEYYVKGVVPNESPASWPIEALKAQAVAARSYALATGVQGLGFDQFADTRSQVYRGLSSETAASNRAVEATAGEVVTYAGEVAVTYFFSTSGGRTENIELAWPGSRPRPWLKSVPDPYDGASPHHRWRVRLSQASMERRLGKLVPGRLRSIRVLERGRSPRIVYAEIVGSEGRRRVTGATLRKRLKLRDTWAYFIRVVTEKKAEEPAEEPPQEPAVEEQPQEPDMGTGGQPGDTGLGSGGAPSGG